MEYDDDGFLWIGGEVLDVRTIVLSDKKLSIQRFNGSTFHTITLPDYEEQITRVSQIYKRDDGKFYIYAYGNSGQVLFLFDPISIKFEKIKFPDNQYPLNISRIFSYQEKDYFLLKEGSKITLYYITEDLNFIDVFSYTDNDEKISLGSPTKFIPFKDFCLIGNVYDPVKIFDWKGNIIKKETSAWFKEDRTEIEQKLSTTSFFKKDSIYYTFLDNNPKLFYIDEENIDIIPVKDEKEFFIDNRLLVNDSLGNNLILNVHNNVLRLSSYTSSKLVTKGDGIAFENSVLTKAISTNLNKGVWIGTENLELHYIEFQPNQIKNYLKDKSIRAIAAIDSLNFLIASEKKGWFLFNTMTNKISPYIITENGIPLKPYSTRNIIVEGDTIWANDDLKILKVNRKTKALEAYRHYLVICMEKANDSTIVYGTKGYNLMEFNTRTKKHRSLLATDSLFIYDLAINNNLIVAGTDKGVLTYNLKTSENKFYQDLKDLDDSFILMVDYTREHGFTIGTRSGKAIQFNPENETFTTVYSDKLKASIATIVYDEDTWWINTFNGLVAYNMKDKTATRFSEKDGLSHNEANRYSALKTPQGIFAGSLRGLNYFNPKELKINEDNSTIQLLRIKSYNKSLGRYQEVFDRNKLKNKKTIVLPAEHKDLELDFSLNNSITNSDNSYRYRLNNEPWSYLTIQRSLHFPNMEVGNHTLKIEALNFSGNKIGEPLILAIESRNFIYKTWWFISFLILAILSLLFYFLKQFRLREKLQEKFSLDLLRSQEVERNRIAKELHDSVGQQLTLIKRKAQNENHPQISDLTNNALEEVRNISKGLYPANLKLVGLTESIIQLIDDIDEENDIFFSVDIDNIDAFFNEEETLNFYRFIQEALQNILKHSQAKTASLTISKKNNWLKVLIMDNGKGFDYIDKKMQNSLGLKTMNERIKLLKGRLFIRSIRNKKTTIIAEIPV